MVAIDGVVKSKLGDVLTDFNGTVYLSLFDKPQTVYYASNDPASTAYHIHHTNGRTFQRKSNSNLTGRFHFQISDAEGYQLSVWRW